MKKIVYLMVLAIVAGSASTQAELLVGWDGSAAGDQHVNATGVSGALFIGNAVEIDTSKGSNDGDYGTLFSGVPTGAQGAYKVATQSDLNRIRIRIVNSTGSDLQLSTVNFDYSRWFNNSPTAVTLSYHTGDLDDADDTLINSVSGLAVLGSTADYNDFDWSLSSLSDTILADGQQAEFDLTVSAGATQTASGAFDNVAIGGSVIPEPATISMLGLGAMLTLLIRRWLNA